MGNGALTVVEREPGPPLEVLDQWVPDDGDRSGGGPRRAVAVIGALVAVAVVVLGLFSGEPGEASLSSPPVRDGDRGGVLESRPPPRLAEPLGYRLVALTMSGLAVLDLDDGRFTDLDLGSVRSFSSAPALAAVDPETVAVLFADRSVGLVSLRDRSVTRVAEGVQGVAPTARSEGFWVRRLLDDGGWELSQLDPTGRPAAVPVRLPGPNPPVMVHGRPVAAARADGTLTLSRPGAPFLVEAVEQRTTLHSFDVTISDEATGVGWTLTGLQHPPVVSPDGRRLVLGESVGNKLTVIDLESRRSETVEVPRSGTVGLDWGNLVVLPAR